MNPFHNRDGLAKGVKRLKVRLLQLIGYMSLVGKALPLGWEIWELFWLNLSS